MAPVNPPGSKTASRVVGMVSCLYLTIGTVADDESYGRYCSAGETAASVIWP